MGVTDFFKKHTRHSTPLFVAGVVFVGVPVLTTLDSGMESLSKLREATAYDWNRMLIKTGIVGLSALGGFMSTVYKEWREEKKRLSETELSIRSSGQTESGKLKTLG